MKRSESLESFKQKSYLPRTESNISLSPFNFIQKSNFKKYNEKMVIFFLKYHL